MDQCCHVACKETSFCLKILQSRDLDLETGHELGNRGAWTLDRTAVGGGWSAAGQ